MLVFPALYIGSQELLAFLKDIAAAGLSDRVLSIHRAGFVATHKPPGRYIIDDFSCVEALCAKLGKWCEADGSTFSAVLGIDDEEQFRLSAAVAAYFKLPYYSRESLQAASNKYVMKERFLDAGVPAPSYRLVSTDENVQQTDISFPNVLKLVSGSGSEYVFLNHSRQVLLDNFQQLKRLLAGVSDDTRLTRLEFELGGRQRCLNTRDSFLLEEFVEGVEYSCDFLVEGGDVTLLRVTRKFEAGPIGLFQGFWLMNAASLAEQGLSEKYLLEVCGRVAAALIIDRAVCMLDFKYDGKRLLVIETSLRPGFASFVPLMLDIYSFTSLGVRARQLLGQAVPSGLPDVEGLVINILAPRAGRVKEIDLGGLQELQARVNIIRTHLYAEPGEEVPDLAWDRFSLMLGWVSVKLKASDKPFEVLEQIKAAVKVEMQDG